MPPRCPRRLAAAIAAASGIVSTAAGFAAGRGRVAGLTDEGFRYLLSRAWADGEPIHQVFQLLYVGGQYVYFGTFLRLFGPQLEVLRFAEQVLGGVAVAIVVLAVGRAAGPGLTAAAGAALAFLALPGFATVASALVLAAAVDLAARASDGGGIPAWWPFGAGLLAGLLAGWREDSAVLALLVALAAAALRRRPLDAVRRVLPGVLLGLALWLAIFALRGEAADFVAHVGRRLGFLVGRLDEPNPTSWRFPGDPFASRQALLAALFPFVAAVPPLIYAALLVREGLRWWRGGAVRWTSVAATAAGCAYLPQFLWEQPDHDHLWAHLHLLLGVAAIGMAGERLRWRRLGAAALAVAAIGGSGFLVTRGDGQETVLYPCCEGRRIGARVAQPPPPWAGLAHRSGDALLVLDWGAGWYVVEGLSPPTRFLHPGGRELTAEDGRELIADLLDPGVGWVITDGLGGVPPQAIAALRRHYAAEERWRGWRLWRRLPD